MFFRKKVEERIDRRKQYRKRRLTGLDVRVQLVTPSGVTQGEFQDLSVHGVGVSFLLEQDPCLAPDDVVELIIESPQHGRVMTPARAVYGMQGDERHIRYGFEFINIGNLYAQLDSFYARLFNRRGSMRVRPSLEQPVSMRIKSRSTVVHATMVEISATGAGVVLPMATAYQLQGVDSIEVSFKLPGIKEEFAGRAAVLNRKTVIDRVFIGMAFDLESEEGLRPAISRLQQFVEERAAEMDRWEASWD